MPQHFRAKRNQVAAHLGQTFVHLVECQHIHAKHANGGAPISWCITASSLAKHASVPAFVSNHERKSSHVCVPSRVSLLSVGFTVGG